LDNFEELFERRNQASTRELKLLQLDYTAEDWLQTAQRSQRLRGDEAGYEAMEPGFRLWVNALGGVALAELGRRDEAGVLLQDVDAEVERLLEKLPAEQQDSVEQLQLLRAAVHCRYVLLEGEPAARELAKLRGLLESSTRQPHQLLPYQSVLLQGLYDAGLDTEVVELAPRILGFNPNHPRTLLVAGKAEARLRQRDEAIDYIQRYLQVMRDADETHPRVAEARRLLDRLSPSS
jgi:hypothetical protein